MERLRGAVSRGPLTYPALYHFPGIGNMGASLRFMQTAPATCNDCLQVAPQRHNISAGTRHKADRLHLTHGWPPTNAAAKLSRYLWQLGTVTNYPT